MLHTMLIFTTGIVFWLMVLNMPPFNYKDFEILAPYIKKYRRFLMVCGSLLLAYSVFMIAGF